MQYIIVQIVYISKTTNTVYFADKVLLNSITRN